MQIDIGIQPSLYCICMCIYMYVYRYTYIYSIACRYTYISRKDARSYPGIQMPIHIQWGERYYWERYFITCSFFGGRQRAIEVTLASSRLGASIVTKSAGTQGGRGGGAGVPRLAFRRVDAAQHAEYVSASLPGIKKRESGERAREIARKWDRYAADEDGAHLC